MSSQHLSDEAVAAFADGVLGRHARERATRHTNECAECAHAVRVQREAAWRLRAAGAPALPTGLLDRLRTVPDTTELTGLPTAIDPDGTAMFSTTPLRQQPEPAHRGFLGQPMAALVPHRAEPHAAHRSHPLALATAAVLTLAGAVTAGTLAVAHADSTPSHPGDAHLVRHVRPAGADHHVPGEGPAPVIAFRSAGR